MGNFLGVCHSFSRVDDSFLEIFEEMLKRASKIKCSNVEYAAGLQIMARELELAAEAALCTHDTVEIPRFYRSGPTY